MDNTPRASIHVGDPAKSFSAAEGSEPERRGWDKNMYQRKNQDTNNHYDYTRKKLNFELDSTRKPLELGSNPIPLHERVKNRLDELGFSPYYEKDRPDVIADNSPNCTVTIIFGGNHDVLHKLAYGDQDVDLTLQRSNAHIRRKAEIENWAKDTYDFVCRRYGAENVIGFDVHLDETTPHAQVQIIPVAKVKTRGRKTSVYVKKDDPKEILSSKQWKKLSKEEQGNYTKTEKAKDEKECVSYARVFGETKFEVMKTYSQLHTDYYNEVGHKYGLERGTCIKDLPFEEQLDHIHKNKNILEAERVSKERLEEKQSAISILDDKKAELEQQTKEAERKKEL
ncbi:MAG: plasmid recombination protein, partial [Prevotella sp.]|nr:plasmid recombination protein [Prevotella sp.]